MTTVDEPEKSVARSSLTFPVVGIGASAGGLVAMRRFLDRTPERSGMAYVLILHLSPAHESSVAEILQNHTAMKVLQVTEVVRIEPDHVYVIPPVMDLQMSDGHIRPAAPTRKRGPHVAVDVFFRTLAAAHRDRAVAIVLSGMGSDGAVGVARIREMGGVSFAQSPEDAEFDSMPRAAIATGAVDFVMTAEEMPRRLASLWANVQNIRLPDAQNVTYALPVIAPPEREAAEQAFKHILATLRARTQHDFRHYKRATVLRRIERRMQVSGQPDLPAYQAYLTAHFEEANALLQDMLISVTNFFRDRDAYHVLENVVIPQLFAGRTDGEPVRVWVPGCATGEEAYSIAMLLREHADRQPQPPDFQVFATDIDAQAIAVGRAGYYAQGIVADITPARLRRFFRKDGEQYRVIAPLRDKVLFAAHNVLRDPPFSRVDLISCRNLLIYLQTEAQHRLLDVFRFALRGDGHLFLGSAESADTAEAGFRAIDKRAHLFQVNPGAPTRRSIATSLPAPDERAPSIVPMAPERKLPSPGDWHRRAIAQFAAPSLLVDAQHFIVHMGPGVNEYLLHASGPPSLELMANMRPELRLEMRSAVYRAQQGGQSVAIRSRRKLVDGTERYVRIVVQPFRETDHDVGYCLITFLEDDERRLSAPDAPAEERSSVLRVLESEVEELKRHLQETLERSDTSNEELRASNEELQAINEELRSASEELETSKEELQSVNEELVTVNYELKNKVDETAQINDDLQNLIASTDLAVVFVDGALRVKRYTPRAVDLFNFIPGDVGRPLLDIRHRLDTTMLAADADKAFHQLRTVEREIVAEDGRIYLSRVLPYRTVDNKIEGAVMTFVDITSRVQAERRAVADDQRLRAATATHEFAIMTMDESGTIQTWNAGAQKTFGYAEDEIVGKDYALIFTAEDRAADVPRNELAGALARGHASDDRWHLRKDGTRVFCSGVVTSYDGVGSASGFAKIARDVTQSKQAGSARDEALQSEAAARRASETANRAKDEFLAVMSHELKHPLNLIHVNAELLMRRPELMGSEPVRRAAEAIRTAVAGQARIIDDLLDLSRARVGKMTLALVQAPLDAIVRRIADAAAHEAADKRIAFAARVEPDVDFVVACDPMRIEQVLWNLFSNAIKFTPPGGRVDVSLARDGIHARLDVRDTGVGIAPGFLPNVFSMFQQQSRQSTAIGGMGIGLALVKELVEAQGGSVAATSPGEDRGSTFTVLLPLAHVGQITTPPPDASAGGLHGVRILAVDDMVEVLEPFAELLRMEGAEVTEALGGQAALAALEPGRFDVLVSDIGMPGMDGYELMDRVRRTNGVDRIVAIALTGYGRAGDEQRALQVGYNAHLSKPATVDDIRITVVRLLDR